jgi:hypothetical protein
MQSAEKLQHYAKATCEGARHSLVNDVDATAASRSLKYNPAILPGEDIIFMFFCAVLVMLMQYGFAAVRTPGCSNRTPCQGK